MEEKGKPTNPKTSVKGGGRSKQAGGTGNGQRGIRGSRKAGRADPPSAATEELGQIPEEVKAPRPALLYGGTRAALPVTEGEERVPIRTAQEELGPSPALPTSDVKSTHLYGRLIQLARLTDVHRDELRQRRGFTSETIDRFQLRSGGAHLAEIIDRMRVEYADGDLQQAGFLVEVNGRLQPNGQLTSDRVLIPYLNERGAVYHLRPHKLGFAEVPPEPYARWLLRTRPEHVVLTEGEFKAMALHQWGIPALSVPGVSSFGDRHFDRLTSLLREFGVRQVTVIFDNEEKGDPALASYKARAESRYDTQLWAYLMAYKLGRDGFVSRVGVLPDEWRGPGGKTDFDGALAAGHTREEILAVIGRAQAPRDYLEGLPEEARRVVKRKIARHFSRLNVRREFHRYVITRYRDGEAHEETISNFVINIKSSFFTPEGVVRLVQLVNEHGETSDSFPLDPGSMAGLNEFKKFCFSKGNYIFSGRTADLTEIWELEFLRDTGELVYMPGRIGRVDDRLWLFGNLAIAGGALYRPDNDGICWVAGRGYKPQSLQVGPQGESVEDAIPALSERPLDIRLVAERLRDAIGGYEAYIGLGWMVAVLFGEEIFRRYKCLPILFAHGKRESGKSTLMRWLMNFFGVESEGYGLAETTQNFLARALSYYGSLGCWFDEYRNEPKVTAKDGYLRSAYNRQLSGKGTATAFQARGFAVHAAVAISGEELPRDNGLYTRLVPVQISAHKRSRTWFDWLNRNCTDFSSFTRELLLAYDTHRDRVLEAIAGLKEVLVQRDVSDRTAENWAICAGAFDAAILQDDGFIRWVEERCQEIRRVGEAEHILNQFWEDVGVMISAGELDAKQIKAEGDFLYLWYSAVYDAWAIHYRKKTGREPFDRLSIRKYLGDEPYYAGERVVRLDKTNRKAVVVDLEQATDTIRELAESLGLDHTSAEDLPLGGGRGWN